MAFPDRIFEYYPSDMPPSGISEKNTDSLSHNADMPARSRQQQPVWQSLNPVAFSPPHNIVNPSPNSEAQIPYINSASSVMHRVVPMQQQHTIRQQATPHQSNEQERSFAAQIMPSKLLPWDYPDFLTCGEQYRSHQPNDPPSEIKCHWKDCRYTGTFGRKAELKRHIETQHISPKAYKCPECGRPCNRDDNLNGHLRRVHKSEIPDMLM